MTQEQKDNVTVGQIRKRYLRRLENEIDNLSKLIRRGYHKLPEAKSFLESDIAKTLCDLQNIDSIASTEVMFPAQEDK